MGKGRGGEKEVMEMEIVGMRGEECGKRESGK